MTTVAHDRFRTAPLLSHHGRYAGPTVLILNLLPGSIGHYLADLASMAARTGADGPATAEWLQSWTVFYWAWWISWTPFVGMFIARISRGRTIRQFIAGVILIPSVVSLVWFAIFGGAAISAQQAGQDLASGGQEEKLFGLLQSFPLGTLLSVVAMLLVAIFFVSGADAASVVMGTMSQKGSIEPGRGIVIFWGTVMGAIAAIMLLVGGDDALTGIQNITIIMALPFVIITVLLCVSVWKDLRSDPLIRRSVRAGGGRGAGRGLRHEGPRRRLHPQRQTEVDGRRRRAGRGPGRAHHPAGRARPHLRQLSRCPGPPAVGVRLI